MSKLKIQATSTDRRETDAWLETYASEEERRRRRREMPAKLRKLGLDQAPRGIDILDMCCGHGEALDLLYEMNFRQLCGIDLTVTEALAKDSRFRVVQGDVTHTSWADSSFDWITCIHSLHHLASADNVERFMNEAWRLLRPGGRLSVIDFPGSPQIKLAFWFFRQPRLHLTPYMKYFGRIIQEEWSFLRYYIPQWPQVRRHLRKGRFEVERSSSTLFYYYLTLQKPATSK